MKKNIRISSAALATLVLASSHASALNQTWSNTGTASANWSEGTNWSGGAAPGSTSATNSTDVATFDTTVGTYGTTANPILIDSGRNINRLSFNGSSLGNYTIGTTGGNALHMTSLGSIRIESGYTGNNTTISINAPLLMYGHLIINNAATNNSNNRFVIGGNISSATGGLKELRLNSASANNTHINDITGLISDGAGTVSIMQNTSGGIWRLLNDANSFTGNLTIQGGNIQVSSIGNQGVASAAGAGAVINLGSSTAGGSFTYIGSAAATNKTFNLASTTGGSSIINNGSGLLKLTSNITVTGDGNKTLSLRGTGTGEVAGSIVNHASGNRTALTKFDAGIWTLSGNNTYTGNTTVTAGTLVFQNKATRTGGSLVTAAAGGTVGLGVGAGGVTDYSDADVASLFNSTLSGFTLNAASGVAIDTTAGNFTQSTALTAARALTKLGINTLTLSGNNTYSGATTISQGTLAVNGSLAGGVTVSANATLEGSGTISGNSTISGNLKPGNSPGLLTFQNSVTLQPTANTTMEIVGNSPPSRGVTYDAIDVGGALAYGGTLILDFSGTAYGVGNYTFNLFDFGTQSGSFTTMSLAGIYSGSFNNNSGIWGYTAGDNTWSFNQGDGVLTFTVVPEPNAAMVVGSLLLMTLLRRRRD